MTMNKPLANFSWRRTASSIPLYLAFIVFTILVLLPVYWMTRSAFATSTDLIKLPLVYFPQPTLRNFATLTGAGAIWPVSAQLTCCSPSSTTLATLFVSYLAAYAFARIRFPGSGVFLWILLLSMALPDIGTIVPLYQILKTLHLSDSIAGISLVLTSTLTPFTVWVLVSFIKQVPYEIEEAAILDGASLPQILWHILLPGHRSRSGDDGIDQLRQRLEQSAVSAFLHHLPFCQDSERGDH